MYQDFAYLYDALQKDVPYGEFADYYEKVMERFNNPKGLCLDLGCGTGNMTMELNSRGFDMIGVDSSLEMLDVAREKACDAEKSILYLNQDMTSFELYGTVSTVVSTLDCVNYVTDEDALETLVFVETDLYQNMVNNVLDSAKFKEMKTRYYYLTNDESYYDYGRFNMENARVLTFEEYHERSLLSEIMNFDHPMSLLNRSASDGFFLNDKLTEEQIEQFKKCIAEDYKNITVQKMFFPTEQAEYILRFDEEYVTDWYDDTETKMTNPSEYDTEYSGAEIAIYPWMTKTMAFITENDMAVKQLTAEDVSCIFTVSVEQAIKNYAVDFYSYEDYAPVQQIFTHHWRDEYYEAVSTFSLYDKKITDKAEIEQYLDSYMSSYCYFAQDGEMVMFKLEDNSRFYAFVPKK